MSQLRPPTKFLPLKFIRASESHLSSQGHANPSTVSGSLQGQDARSFYEDVISEAPSTSTSQPHRTQQPKKTRKKEIVRKRVMTSRDCHQFLRAAQEGNVEALEKLYREGMDVNCADDYGWTALMCAVKGEQLEAVEYLVSVGANPYFTDSQGLGVFGMLKDCKDSDIVNVFLYDEDEGDNVEDVRQPFFCSLCKANFTETEKDHETSTLHLFNLGKKPRLDLYSIPETNKGFQMMVKSGWNKEKGLGSEGQGKQYPVKTVLKRDRLGLGIDQKNKAKVTHFGPNDKKAVENKYSRMLRPKTLKKRDRVKQLDKQRRKEINFRMEFKME